MTPSAKNKRLADNSVARDGAVAEQSSRRKTAHAPASSPRKDTNNISTEETCLEGVKNKRVIQTDGKQALVSCHCDGGLM